MTICLFTVKVHSWLAGCNYFLEKNKAEKNAARFFLFYVAVFTCLRAVLWNQPLSGCLGLCLSQCLGYSSLPTWRWVLEILDYLSVISARQASGRCNSRSLQRLMLCSLSSTRCEVEGDVKLLWSDALNPRSSDIWGPDPRFASIHWWHSLSECLRRSTHAAVYPRLQHAEWNSAARGCPLTPPGMLFIAQTVSEGRESQGWEWTIWG